jgi:hypothetical protein
MAYHHAPLMDTSEKNLEAKIEATDRFQDHWTALSLRRRLARLMCATP